MKKKNERVKGVKRVLRPSIIAVSEEKGETLADRLEVIVDQILDGGPEKVADLRRPAAAPMSLRPTGRKMSEDEINSLMERMIFSEHNFTGYTH